MKLRKISAGILLWSIMTACSAGVISAGGASYEVTVGTECDTSQDVSVEDLAEKSVVVSGTEAEGSSDTVVDEAVSGETAADETISEGTEATEETVSGEAAADETISEGTEATEETVSGEAAADETIGGEIAADKTLSGDSAVVDESLSDDILIEEATATGETTVGATIRRDIEDGVYVLMPRLNTSRCVSVVGNSKAGGVGFQLVGRNGGFAQAFFVTKVPGTSRYTLVNYHSRLAMKIDSNGSVIQDELTSDMNQQWVIEDLGNGYLQFRLCGKNQVLTLESWTANAGTKIKVERANETDVQMWTLVKAQGKVAAEARLVDAELTRGYYRIMPYDINDLSVDITSNSKNNKANIRLYSKINTGAQLFRVVPKGDGTYTINGYNSGKYFDCENARGGSNIYQNAARGSGYQCWYILKDTVTDRIVIRNKYGSHVVMSIDAAEKGANVSNVSFAATPGQYWTFSKIYSGNIHVEPKDGIYEFRSGLNGNMCLDVAAGSSLNNANVQIFSSNGSDAQRFAIVGGGYGVYRVVNVNSMRALHLSGNKDASGTNVVQYRCLSSQAQKWRIFWNYKTRGYQVQPYGKSTRLAVAGGKAADGTNVQTDTADNSIGQMWVPKRISSYDGTYHMKVMCSGMTCTFKVYQIVNGVFTEKLSTSGYIGRQGAGKTIEGDAKTPIGTFIVGKAYGIADNPGSVIPYTKITNDMYWCCRPDSPYYNTLIDASKAGAGDEHLIEYPEDYQYMLDIGYNTACTPGLGSAVFLHCSRNEPTAGCIAIPAADMARTLQMIGVGTKISIE